MTCGNCPFQLNANVIGLSKAEMREKAIAVKSGENHVCHRRGGVCAGGVMFREGGHSGIIRTVNDFAHMRGH